MKHKLFSMMLLLVMALVACSPTSTPTEPPPTATEPPPTPTDVPELVPTEAPLTESALEPGGVEVALTLLTIPDEEIIARVNGQEISAAVYQEELERSLYSVTNQYALDWNDPQTRSFLPTFQEQVLDQIIDRTLLQQLAGQEDISAAPEEIEAEIELIQAEIQDDENIADWDSFLVQYNLTEETLRSLLADQILVEALIEIHGGSQLVEHVLASHILVETEATGQEVLNKLADGEEFSTLAAEYSIDTSNKDQGGDLGWFPPGMMVPAFEAAAFSLKPGEISELVPTDFGYHIIQVNGKEEREMDPALFEQLQPQRFQAWFETQQAAANVERFFSFEGSE